ncbi:hypothetical protein NG55_01125 [Acinetobacter gyllenbergii]|nr:hypothetical protein NG55_01125 [Acinetobacter gyllenbergii]
MNFFRSILTFFSWLVVAFPAIASLNFDPLFLQIVLFFLILFFIVMGRVNVFFYILSCIYILVVYIPPYMHFVVPYMDGVAWGEILGSLIDKKIFNLKSISWVVVYTSLYSASTFFLIKKNSNLKSYG